MKWFTADYLSFFKELESNNHKEWFDANRKRYEANVKKPFYAFTDHMIGLLAKGDPSLEGITAKDCVFRINRDIRFSNDKTPYKLNQSAIITPMGRKNHTYPGVYFEASANDCRVYGGVYFAEKDALNNIRTAIAANVDLFESIISDKAFVDVYGEVQGEKNVRLPKEFEEAAKRQSLLFNKQWYFFTKFAPESILQDELDQRMLKAVKAGEKMTAFLKEAI
jgi:uncharacterized protein (TIGR02453 family)